MRVAIASRIFEPEPSAASFRLGALAAALAAAGHEVTVLTVRPPARLAEQAEDAVRPYRVKRARVLRDRTGYVRGYVQYMSFDIPLFFRLLFGPRYDLVVSEPPPTTGFFVRMAMAMRRTPYAYYAADIWSDASSQTGAPALVVRMVGALERFALRGARLVFSVSEGVTGRLAELGVSRNVATIGNGIDTEAFREPPSEHGNSAQQTPAPEFVYAGTASEWHGAGVFVEAMPAVLEREPAARLRFIGGGSELEALEARAQELGIAASVSFEETLPPAALGPVLRRAAAAVASVRPGAGYDFAFPTKLYSASACGAPLIYAGIGPAVEFVRTEVGGLPLGRRVAADPGEAAAAMVAVIDERAATSEAERRARSREVAEWAEHHVSLRAVAAKALREIDRAVPGAARAA